MIREVLNGNFMDCEKVKAELQKKGFKKAEIRSAKIAEGIKTVPIQNSEGARKWLWYVPDEIWRKY